MSSWRMLGLAAIIATAAACATCAGRIPLPKQYAVANLGELVARMRTVAVSETLDHPAVVGVGLRSTAYCSHGNHLTSHVSAEPIQR